MYNDIYVFVIVIVVFSSVTVPFLHYFFSDLSGGRPKREAPFVGFNHLHVSNENDMSMYFIAPNISYQF